MTDLPRNTIPRIQSINKSKESSWSVMVYYLNASMVDDNNPHQPYGLVVPCGEFGTREQAEELRDKISITTGATFTAICKNNHAMTIGPHDPENTVVYKRNEEDCMETIERSLHEAKERSLAVEKEIQDESLEQDDDTTISYLMRRLFLIANARSTEDVARSNLKQAEDIKARNTELVLNFFQRNPEKLSTWKSEVKSRLGRRRETLVYDLIENTYSEIIEPKLKTD